MTYIPFAEPSIAAGNYASMVVFSRTITPHNTSNLAYLVGTPVTTGGIMGGLGYFNVTDVWLHVDTMNTGDSFTISIGINDGTFTPPYDQIVAPTSTGPCANNKTIRFPVKASTVLNGYGLGSGDIITAQITAFSTYYAQCSLFIGGFYTNARNR